MKVCTIYECTGPVYVIVIYYLNKTPTETRSCGCGVQMSESIKKRFQENQGSHPPFMTFQSAFQRYVTESHFAVLLFLLFHEIRKTYFSEHVDISALKQDERRKKDVLMLNER